jgi:hypothetical protein
MVLQTLQRPTAQSVQIHLPHFQVGTLLHHSGSALCLPSSFRLQTGHFSGGSGMLAMSLLPTLISIAISVHPLLEN